jgi:response regulator RpfG family c-di-GMP phosphodiesterase
MTAEHGGKYLDRLTIGEAEEQAKRWWKTLLLLLALALKVKYHTQDKAEIAWQVAEAITPRIAKVLLIDTDPESSGELTGVLGIGGFEVMTSLKQEEILEGLAQVSLVILDEELPHSQELCTQIRERSQVPIIILGSDPSEEAWNRAVAWGADAYLRRAISRREFVARIRAILRRYLQARHISAETGDAGDQNGSGE